MSQDFKDMVPEDVAKIFRDMLNENQVAQPATDEIQFNFDKNNGGRGR